MLFKCKDYLRVDLDVFEIFGALKQLEIMG